MSADGLVLYAATDGGWMRLGRSPIEGRQVVHQMEVLRRIARTHVEQEQLEAVLVVPEDQALWLQYHLDLPDGTEADQVAPLIAERLEGQTPYALDELRYDCRLGAAQDGIYTVEVAVIALDTLREAESFARRHGFSPTGVIAYHQGASFPGTAWFGLAALPQTANGLTQIDAPHDGTIQALPEAGLPDLDPAPQTPAQRAAKVHPIDHGSVAPGTATPKRRLGPQGAS